MRYAPPGLCLNDFDIINLDDLYHVFHLQASPTYPFDATKLETSYGHAVSRDLIFWETKDTIFWISDPPHFDDGALWTMHIVSHSNRLWMFYTGLNQRIYFQQQIGLAYSDRTDGTDWIRYSENPIVSADPKWYQTEGDMAWRDPFVVYDEEHQRWIMYIAAKHNNGPMETRGCIGLALSDDLIHWEVQPSILAPRQFGEMECPVIYHINNAYYMFVSVSNFNRIYSYCAPDLMGPFEFLGVLTQPYDYAPRIVITPKNESLLIHTVKCRWSNTDLGEIVRGLLAQPKRLQFDELRSPYLSWYSTIESYLESTSVVEANNGLFSLSIPPESRQVNARLRVIEENSEQKGLEVIMDQDYILLQYLEDKQALQRELVNNYGAIQNIKVLLFREYIEIYLNNRLIISTMAYRHQKGRFEAWADGKPINFSFYPFKTF
ncbi:MAG: family 43 glycosylhydrolase [Candidatus Heimdallarchaeota archaeon]